MDYEGIKNRAKLLQRSPAAWAASGRELWDLAKASTRDEFLAKVGLDADEMDAAALGLLVTRLSLAITQAFEDLAVASAPTEDAVAVIELPFGKDQRDVAEWVGRLLNSPDRWEDTVDASIDLLLGRDQSIPGDVTSYLVDLLLDIAKRYNEAEGAGR